MKPINLKKLSVRFSACMVLIIAAFIIHSCKKDSKFIQLSAADSVNQAKSWYESAYPVNNALSVNNNLTTLGVNTNSSTAFDYSQHIKPDWNHAGKYKRFGKDIIEMPVDPGKVLSYGLKNASTGQLTSAKENSRAWFLLVNDGKAYSAYIMVLIGDPGYINGDPSKMAKNSYRKRDANFSGMLLYFTPKGQFIRSYKYVNGQQVTPASSVASASTKQTQSTGKKTNQVAYVDCTDWYWMVYDSNGNIISLNYMYTICIDVPGDGGGDPGSGGGGAPSPPPTCEVTNAVTKQAVNQLPPDPTDPGDGGDPGYPDPTQGSACQPSGSVTDTIPTVDSVDYSNPVKPCALKFKKITSNWMAIAVTGYTIGIQDNVFGRKFITFNIQIGMPNYVSIQQAQTATAAAMAVAEAVIAQTHGVDFFLSPVAQTTYSKEFANIVQSELALSLQIGGIQVQNSISAGVPIITYANSFDCK